MVPPLVLRTLATAAAACRSAVVRGLAVLVVTLAVVGMHALGMGHAAPMGAMASMTASVTGASTSAHATGHSATAPVDEDQREVRSGDATCVPGCASLADHSGPMSDLLCLAVLPILTLLLLGLRHHRRALDVRDRAVRRGVSRSRSSRALPRHLTPSLSELCVLRV